MRGIYIPSFPMCPKSSSTGGQYAILEKYFSHPRLVIYLFSNTSHKTKIGIVNRWETTNSNPPGPIKLSSQSTEGSAVPFTSLSSILWKNVGPKPFCWAELPCFEFSSFNFLLLGQIPITGRVALTHHYTHIPLSEEFSTHIQSNWLSFKPIRDGDTDHGSRHHPLHEQPYRIYQFAHSKPCQDEQCGQAKK